MNIGPRKIKSLINSQNELEVFEHFFGQKIILGKKYCNPTREDENPGCTFVYSKTEPKKLLFCDWAKHRFYDLVLFVCERYNISYSSAVTLIGEYLSTKPRDYSNEFTQPKKISKVKIRKILHMDSNTSADWFQKNIFGPAGVEYEVDSRITKVKFLLKQRDFEEIAYKPNEVCIAYRYSDGYKLYFPDRKKDGIRFEQYYSNSKELFWINHLNESEYRAILITKSIKDGVVLNYYLNTIGGLRIKICVVQSESTFMSEQDITLIKSSGVPVYLLYDSDERGIENAVYYSEKYDIINITLPIEVYQGKDSYELARYLYSNGHTIYEISSFFCSLVTSAYGLYE